MKRIVLFILPLLIISCNNKERVNEVDSDVKSFYFLTDVDSSSYSKKSLIEEKFKEFYDLNILLKKYPDFKEGIENRIKNFISNSETIFELNDSLSVKNIRQEGPLTKISDSVQMTKIYYDLVSENSTEKDSVFAFITKKKIMIDEEEVLSTKVKFTRVVIQKFR